jgi:hypothetical protein
MKEEKKMKRAKTIREAIISCGLILAGIAVFSTFSVAQSAATKSKASKSWSAFWTKFGTVVRNKDRKTFVDLTTEHYHNAGGETINEWLQGAPWGDLKAAINKGTKPYNGHDKQVWRVTKNDYLLFVFEKGRWVFYGELVA